MQIQIEVVAISTEEEGFTEVRPSPALKSGLLQAPWMALALRGTAPEQTFLDAPLRSPRARHFAACVIAHYLTQKRRKREARGIENRDGDAALSGGTKQPEATVALSLLCAVCRSL